MPIQFAVNKRRVTMRSIKIRHINLDYLLDTRTIYRKEVVPIFQKEEGFKKETIIFKVLTTVSEVIRPKVY